ncbi:MAG TPA: glycosyltransferase family 2 protein [Ferruginibacter sp.]|nr:glycosyltransferase family 2 protein [Ferruginibacter sp.]
MKISICIPQYNRINYLLKSLSIIERQNYPDLEIVISDDCSTDDTVAQISALSRTYKFPIVFDRNEKNLGYDRNYRKCIEMASGDYAFVIGNDDSLQTENSITFLVDFLQRNNLPDIGFCNMIEERTGGGLVKRAWGNKVIGAGAEVALRNYSSFSFVGGLIYKRSVFLKYNTAKYDGSIYAQMYLGVYMICNDAVLFCIEEPLVIKDLLLDDTAINSYKDTIARSWKEYKVVDGGLPSVMNVLIGALQDSGSITQARIYYIFRRIYAITFPHWVLDYKENGAFPEAWGLVKGLHPSRNKNFTLLSRMNRFRIYLWYYFAGYAALLTPVFLFKLIKQKLYAVLKRS